MFSHTLTETGERLTLRAQLGSAERFLMERKKEAESNGEVKTKGGDAPNLKINRKVYCEHILGGFKGSAKLESILLDFHDVPLGDKVLMLSFFKGSLDLMEAIFHYELKIDYARFDGDVSPDVRQRELDRFKRDPSCRVLLMSVQTGGTGLNIVEANRCIFIDRWFNPFVHEQAEDRCHRLGQKKDVTVTYHDVNGTIDVVMQHLNLVKTTNATIVLAEGSTLGAATSALTYKEMAGSFKNGLSAMLHVRNQHIAKPENWFRPIPPSDFSCLDQLAESISKSPRASDGRANSSICEAIAHFLGYTGASLQKASTNGHAAQIGRDIVRSPLHAVHPGVASTPGAMPVGNDNTRNSDPYPSTATGHVSLITPDPGQLQQHPVPSSNVASTVGSMSMWNDDDSSSSSSSFERLLERPTVFSSHKPARSENIDLTGATRTSNPYPSSATGNAAADDDDDISSALSRSSRKPTRMESRDPTVATCTSDPYPSSATGHFPLITPDPGQFQHPVPSSNVASTVGSMSVWNDDDSSSASSFERLLGSPTVFSSHKPAGSENRDLTK
jgi:hypothetical protein